jgi:hypothetical protein
VKENGKRKAIMKYGGQLKECKINSAKKFCWNICPIEKEEKGKKYNDLAA